MGNGILVPEQSGTLHLWEASHKCKAKKKDKRSKTKVKGKD